MKIKPDNKQLTIVALILYALIMLSLILVYRDLLITITAVTIMIALLFQYFAPLIRERKEQKAKDISRSDGE